MDDQLLADRLAGFELLASMNPPPGAAWQTAMDNLPAPRQVDTPRISFDMSSFGNGPRL